jgi:Ni/Fe-hydrogenase subunit HybB-like protein
MTDEEKVRELIVNELELFIRAHGWDDKLLQEALYEVAKKHVWRQGLWVRMKVLFIVVAAGGSLASIIAVIANLFGWEFRK